MITPPPPAPSVAVVRGQPPAGMIPAEAAILTTWLDLNYTMFDSVQYNLRVGHGTDPGADFSDSVRNQFIVNTQRRIDALLYQGNTAVIVEVKVRGSLSQLGQLFGYRALWQRDNPGKPEPALLALCGSMDDDAAYVYRSLKVPFVIVLTGTGQ